MKRTRNRRGILIAVMACAIGVSEIQSLEGGEMPEIDSDPVLNELILASEFPAPPTDEVRECTLSLNELITAVAERHPSVVQARSLSDAAYGEWIQAGLQANPEVAYAGDEIGGYKEWGIQGVEVSQEVISKKKRFARQAVAVSDQHVAQQNVSLYTQKAVNDALLAGYAVMIARDKVEMAKDLLELCRKSSETVQTLLDVGETAATDLMVNQIDQMEAESTLAQANLELETAQDNIAILLGESLCTRYTISDCLEEIPLELDEQALWTRILEESPAMGLARAEYAAAVARVNQQAAEAKTNITGVGKVQYNTYERQTEVAVGVSIPVRVNDRNQGNILKAQYEVQAAEANIRRTEMTLRKAFQARLFEFLSARRKVVLYRESLLEKVNKTFEMISEAYAHGQSTYMERLMAEQSLKKVRMDYLDSLHSMVVARILLEGFLLENADE